MSSKRRHRHSPAQVVEKLREADRIAGAGRFKRSADRRDMRAGSCRLKYRRRRETWS